MTYNHTALYKQVSDEASMCGEGNDCAIKAISLVTGVSYKRVAELSYKLGRTKGEGTKKIISFNILKALGFEIRHIEGKNLDEFAQIITQTYTGYYQPKNLTLAQVGRNTIWKHMPKMILFTHRHAAACIDGVVHDHAANSKRRIEWIWVVEDTGKPMVKI